MTPRRRALQLLARRPWGQMAGTCSRSNATAHRRAAQKHQIQLRCVSLSTESRVFVARRSTAKKTLLSSV